MQYVRSDCGSAQCRNNNEHSRLVSLNCGKVFIMLENIVKIIIIC